MHHTAYCDICEHTRTWPTAEQARDYAVWHVFENHHQRWVALLGDRPPRNPDPRTENN